MLGWLFVAATCAALISLLLAGFWRRFPCFLVLLAIQAWQGAAVNLGDWRGYTWWIPGWMPVERFRLLFAVLAALEILIRITREMEFVERWGMRVAMLLPIVAAKLMARPVDADALAVFLRWRESVWIALCFGMAMLTLFLLLKPLPLPSWLRWHLWLFTVLIMAHAFIAPLLRLTDAVWIKQQAVYRTIAAACCMAWATFVAQCYSINRNSSP